MLLATSVFSCELDQPYLDLDGPRYSGSYLSGARDESDSLRVVAYNLEFSNQVERAIEVLQSDDLANADLIAMQEMDAPSVDAIAEALGMAYVYYPATIKKGKDFGNAVLSSWPIARDAKILLPHADPYTGSRRIAVRAEVQAGEKALYLYSLHAATMSLGLGARLDQVEVIAKDCEALVGPCMIAGDFNTADPGSASQTKKLLREYSFAWVSADARDTATALGGPLTLDYVFGRGVISLGSATFVGDAGSDHQPIWTLLELR